MALLDDLLDSIRRDAAVTDVRVCISWTAVVSAECGLAAVVPEPERPYGTYAVSEAGSLRGQSAAAVAQLARSDSAVERSIGIAALNSLLEVDRASCVELNAADLLMERGKGKHVAMVGHFPFVSRLKLEVGELSVLELRPQGDDLPASEAGRVIPQADVVAITGSTLVNGTIEGLLALCRPDALVVVLGPTTPLCPVWFDYGVDVVSGTVVEDRDTALRYLSEGASFRQLRGVKLLTMAKR